MGTNFFKSKGSAGAMPMGGSGNNLGLEARAIGAAIGAGRGAAIGAQKDLSKAEGINKGAAFKPLKRSAAYPAGPKL